MSGSEDLKARQEFEASIIEKARTDDDFKKDLLNNPRDALNREIRAREPGSPSIPSHIDVVVHEESSNTIHLVLPMNLPEGELSDEDLEAVAGGYNDDCKEHNPDCSGGDSATGTYTSCETVYVDCNAVVDIPDVTGTGILQR